MNTSRTVSFSLAKGGTTKTTSTINIAAALSKQGCKVAVIDNDPQSNLTTALGYDPTSIKQTLALKMLNTLDESDGMPIQDCMIHCNTFDLLPSNPKLSLVEKRLTVESNSSLLTGDNELPVELIMRKTLAPLTMLYDYILIDCPPSAGLLTINALSASDSVLIPLEAHFLGFEAVKQTLDLILRIKAKLNPKLDVEGILLTKYQSRTSLCQYIRNIVHEEYGKTLPVFSEPIPYSIKAAAQSVSGASIFEIDPNGNIAAGYMSAVKEMMAHEKS